MVVRLTPRWGFILGLRARQSIMALSAFGAVFWCTPRAGAKGDPAGGIVKLFIDACIPNMGNPDGVRAWATAQKLAQIQAAAPLAVFVGAGGKGAAWAVPTPYGNFAVSIRGQTEACATWAQAADPTEVEQDFKTIIESLQRPGIKVRIDKDSTKDTAVGRVHALVYNVIAPGAATGYEFTRLAVERPGGPFQATIQVATASTD